MDTTQDKPLFLIHSMHECKGLVPVFIIGRIWHLFPEGLDATYPVGKRKSCYKNTVLKKQVQKYWTAYFIFEICKLFSMHTQTPFAPGDSNGFRINTVYLRKVSKEGSIAKKSCLWALQIKTVNW
jgi:hypothetical protein